MFFFFCSFFVHFFVISYSSTVWSVNKDYENSTEATHSLIPTPPCCLAYTAARAQVDLFVKRKHRQLKSLTLVCEWSTASRNAWRCCDECRGTDCSRVCYSCATRRTPPGWCSQSLYQPQYNASLVSTLADSMHSVEMKTSVKTKNSIPRKHLILFLRGIFSRYSGGVCAR